MTEAPQELIARLRSGIHRAIQITLGGVTHDQRCLEAADAIAASLARESALIDALARASERESVLRNALGSARKYIQRAPFGLFGVIDAALAQEGAE